MGTLVAESLGQRRVDCECPVLAIPPGLAPSHLLRVARPCTSEVLALDGFVPSRPDYFRRDLWHTCNCSGCGSDFGCEAVADVLVERSCSAAVVGLLQLVVALHSLALDSDP